MKCKISTSRAESVMKKINKNRKILTITKKKHFCVFIEKIKNDKYDFIWLFVYLLVCL